MWAPSFLLHGHFVHTHRRTALRSDVSGQHFPRLATSQERVQARAIHLVLRLGGLYVQNERSSSSSQAMQRERVSAQSCVESRTRWVREDLAQVGSYSLNLVLRTQLLDKPTAHRGSLAQDAGEPIKEPSADCRSYRNSCFSELSAASEGSLMGQVAKAAFMYWLPIQSEVCPSPTRLRAST